MKRSVQQTVFALCALLSGALLTSGCTQSTTSPQKQIDERLKASGQSRASLGKVAGKVLIDGKTPQEADFDIRNFLAILYNPKEPPSAKAPLKTASIKPDGSFEFSTYDKGDGVPVGSYVMLFDALSYSRARGSTFHEPDRLKNLYNDPDKAQFPIEVSPSGKTDYSFDLVLEGKEPGKPGPHALTSFEP
jgi:hypothetical protein